MAEPLPWWIASSLQEIYCETPEDMEFIGRLIYQRWQEEQKSQAAEPKEKPDGSECT